MTLPALPQLYEVVEATWPAARRQRLGPWTIREGRGGGSRVSAATVEAAFSPADITEAAKAMAALGQPALFMIRQGDTALDAALAALGYAVKDPVRLYAAPVASLIDGPLPAATTFEAWPPLGAQTGIWARHGIGPERIAVMGRANPPKTTILGRVAESPAGTVYVALHGQIAMLHALEVEPAFRRKGLARKLIRASAHWAARMGAAHLSLVVTQANVGANALYSSLDMSPVGQYHYRILPD
jgi:ribosomal protein S18 acetylase RimI-like enzyme